MAHADGGSSSLLQHARRPGDAGALATTDGRMLSHGQLDAFIGRIQRSLRALGIDAGNRVATVLTDGPSAAVAFLGVSAAAACAPLNPDLTAVELRGALDALNPAAVLIGHEEGTVAHEVARALDLPVVEVGPLRGDGDISLVADGRACAARARSTRRPSERDVALLLQTSGTTRAKLVPLTRDNLRSSARAIGVRLRLTPDDRSLAVMPLFHVHGLVASVLAPLVAGGAVVVPPSYRADEMLVWLHTHAATWYSAVPTIHRHVLAAARDAPPLASLRFVRSSSAPLPPTLLQELEESLDVPVIEAYGMTEAAHQIASNPLPPGRRVPGSVGIAAGPAIAVLDENGTELPRGSEGELAIRGANVTPGYLDADDVNERSFVNGWLRTGDQGIVDRDGYVTISGRLKELINRGGEKITPREVDEALLAHPDVEAALAFAMPHPTLGEVVGAAVVLRPGASATEAQLAQHARTRLARFKVPRPIVVVPDLPKGPTGKPRRLGLAQTLGLVGSDEG